MNPTLYDILGVSPDATRDEIRVAWRQAADRFEPGEGGSTKQFRLFNEAAEVLLDPERRREYDAQLGAGGRPEPEPAPAAGPAVASPGTAASAKDEQSVVAPEPATGERQPSAQGASPRSWPVRLAGLTGSVTRLGRGWVVALVVLGLLAAASVALGSYFGTRGLQALEAEREAEQTQEALDRAPAAAETAAARVLAYDYESLEADRDAAAKFLTEEYRAQYVDTFDKLVVESATQTKARVEANVLASATMDASADAEKGVPVLLFVNQVRTSTADAGRPSVALNRVRFDMVEVDGTWLVDGITSY